MSSRALSVGTVYPTRDSLDEPFAQGRLASTADYIVQAYGPEAWRSVQCLALPASNTGSSAPDAQQTNAK